LFRLAGAARRHDRVEAWFEVGDAPLRRLARLWFDRLRGCGEDVFEVLHDGQPTACVGDAAFAYVDAFTGHANIGFFHGASLADPAGLLQGSGKRMRHVRLPLDGAIDEAALEALIAEAYHDIRRRRARRDC
jgi:hypothetical protein